GKILLYLVIVLAGLFLLTRFFLYWLAIRASLHGAKPTADSAKPPHDQSVIVKFAYGSRKLAPIHDLEDKLTQAINPAKVRIIDGHEIAIGGRDGSLYLYGPDADRLFAVRRPILESADFLKGPRVTLRYGPLETDAREVEVKLSRQA